jgi:hypothetical protein
VFVFIWNEGKHSSSSSIIRKAKKKQHNFDVEKLKPD